MKKISIIFYTVFFRRIIFNLIIFSILVLFASCSSEDEEKDNVGDSHEIIEDTYPFEELIDSTEINLEENKKMQQGIFGNLFRSDNLDDYYELINIREVNDDDYYENNVDAGVVIKGYKIGQYRGTNWALLHGEYEKDLSLKDAGMKYLEQQGLTGILSARGVYETISGILPFTKGSSDLPFDNVNPKFIKWTIKHLIPEPDDKIYDQTFQELYDNIMQFFFRKMTMSYIYLKDIYGIEDYARMYREQIEEDESLCLSWLYDNFETLDPVDINNDVYEYSTEAFGFWLRRYMDGSFSSIYEALEIFMKKFDPYWYSSVMNNRTDYHTLSKTFYVQDINKNYPVEEGKYYEITDEKVYLYEKPNFSFIPEDQVNVYKRSYVAHVESLTENEYYDGNSRKWAECTVYAYNNKENKWLLCDQLGKELQNFDKYSTLQFIVYLDTIGNKIHFHLDLVNNNNFDIEIPSANLKKTLKYGTSSSTGSLFDTEKMTVKAGDKISIINDEIIMYGYNKKDIWYAPKSKKTMKLLSIKTDKDGNLKNVHYGFIYTLEISSSSKLQIKSNELKLDLPISEEYVKNIYF